MVIRRRRFKQTQSLEQRLSDEAALLRQEAAKLSGGRRQDALRKARQCDVAARMNERLRSPGLKPPS